MDRLRKCPALHKIQLQFLKSKHHLVGFKKVDWDDKTAKPLTPNDLNSLVKHSASSAADMNDWLEELKERVVVQDDAFQRVSTTNLTRDDSDEDGSNEEDSEVVDGEDGSDEEMT